jgi:hypothetical protein
MTLHCGSLHQYLAMLAVAISSLSWATNSQFGAFVDKHTRHLHFGLHLGRFVACVLVAGHGLAEHLALLHTGQRPVNGGLRRRKGRDGDLQALPRQRCSLRQINSMFSCASPPGRWPAGTLTSLKKSSAVSCALRPKPQAPVRKSHGRSIPPRRPPRAAELQRRNGLNSG